MLPFYCTAVGGGSTIWSVTAFDCTENDIILRHSEFTDGTSGECNDGTITGHSVGVEGNCFSSRLDVTISAELHNKTVVCSLTESEGGLEREIGSTSIMVLRGRLCLVSSVHTIIYSCFIVYA